MTNEDKADLRHIMRKRPNAYSDEEAARICGCSVSTARKYRRLFAPDDGESV